MHNLSGYVSIVTVVKDNPEGFAVTLRSFCSASLFAKFEVIVIDSSIQDLTINNVINRETKEFPGLKCKYYWYPPRGIYEAMNRSLHLCDSKFICFINSGDSIIPRSWLNFILLSQRIPSRYVVYGHTSWSNPSKRVGLVLPFNLHKKIIPFLGRMPNHQCMLIPLHLQRQHPYLLSEYPIAADLEFKHFVNSQYVLYDSSLTIVKSAPGGASQSISSFSDLFMRAFEFSRIQLLHVGFTSSVITFANFIVWHSRKVLLFKFTKLITSLML